MSRRSRRCAGELASVRERGGRLFILGVGGSAGHAGHAVNDFRKLCGFEAYAPTDNVSELTARVNDEGWDTSFSEWLKGSRLRAGDGVLVFSVGGGNRESAAFGEPRGGLELAREGGAKIYRHRRARRRLHGAGGRRVRRHPDGLQRPHHAPHRGLLRGRLAPARQPPEAPGPSRRAGSRISTAVSWTVSRRRVIIVGGAGFIGSHFTDALLADPETEAVTLYDNFSSGRRWHFAQHDGDPRLSVIAGEANDLERLTRRDARATSSSSTSPRIPTSPRR